MKKKIAWIAVGVVLFLMAANVNIFGFRGDVISDVRLANIYAGGCETGCESNGESCSNDNNACNGPDGISNGGDCWDCDSASQGEKCADWGDCMTWPVNTCTTCQVDSQDPCGSGKIGLCSGTYLPSTYKCEYYDSSSSECGSIVECTTVDQ